MGNIWKQFNEIPKINSKIFLLERHWKDVYPTSYELRGYEVRKCDAKLGDFYLMCNDDRGEGSDMVTWKDIADDDAFLWWCYAEDIKDIFKDLPSYKNQPSIDLIRR